MRSGNPFGWNTEFPDAMKEGDLAASSAAHFISNQVMKKGPLEVEIYRELFRAGQGGQLRYLRHLHRTRLEAAE